MADAADKKARSPYQRYGKVPYKYEYPNCTHRRQDGSPSAERQSNATWAGKICTRCNIILDGPR